jgi:CRP-like cAMP-binding protein
MRRVLFLFAQLSDADIEWLMQAGRKERLAPGAVLIREGEPVAFLSVALSGKFAVQSASSRQTLATLEAGDVVGEMSFIDQRPPSASVVALEDSVVLKLSHADFSRKLERDTGFAARFYKAMAITLSNRVRDLQLTGQPGGAAPAELGELDPNAMERIHMAGLKFQRLLQRLT